MEKTSSLTRMAELSSSNLEALHIKKKLPRISDYDLPSIRQRLSEMDIHDAADKTSCDGIPHVEYDDYETLPESSTLSTHLIAGAFAGMAEHCVMYPVDSVKTRMQSMRPSPNAIYKNVFTGLSTIIRNEGANGTVRGIKAVAIGAGPAHALYFACYEKMKKVLSAHPGKSPLANAIAGSLATVIHDAAMNPVDVIKQRMQVYQSPYKTVSDCVRAVWRTEGTHAFYRSYTTQLTMNIPFQSVHFVMYELLQEYLNSDRKYDPKSHMISGGVAGATAAAVTTPLDVCKTLLNTQEHGVTSDKRSINGMLHAFRTIYDLGGVRGYFKGVQARVIFQVPATALSWSIYEFFKYFLTTQWSHT